ncbi:hypothetical protein M1555_03155 [Patescibacteria group bacterium]|nr:hypothetical protein [Patescibacteria group bacterium]
MTTRTLSTLCVVLCVLGSGLVLGDLLRWHRTLGLVRFFDADEFAYLHWAAHMAAGRVPYRDFFLFVPPGFGWFLMPLFFFGHGISPLIAARVMEFAVFTLLVGVTIGLFWLLRRSWLALLAGVFLAFLPLPFDKFIEVRPDTLAALLVTGGIVGEILWMREKGARYGVLAGVLYAASLIVLPKTLPGVVVGVGIAAGSAMGRGEDGKRGEGKRMVRMLAAPALGFLLPLLMFGVWCLSVGNLPLVLYSIFRLPFEVNEISRTFVMMPDLFFYPNAVYFGAGGWGEALLVNHALWMAGLVFGLYRLLTPVLTRGKTYLWEELLLALNFLALVFFYVEFIPLKHAQYLIPIAVFVAWYSADMLDSLWQKMKRSTAGIVVFGVAALGLLGLLYSVNAAAEQPKLAGTNTQNLTALAVLYRTLPRATPVLDLVGSMLYYPDPYYACCLPIGQFAAYLSRPLPPLAAALEREKVPYIYQGEPGRVSTLLPADQEYIRLHYHPVADGDPALLVRH